MSTSNEPRLVGRRNSTAILGIAYELDWKVLESMKEEDRDAQKIKRLNLFCLLSAPPGVDYQAFHNAIEQAMKDKDYDMERPTGPPLEFPLEKLQQLIPKPPNVIEHEHFMLLSRQHYNPNEAVVEREFQAVIDEFRTSQLYEQFKILVLKVFQQTNCKAVVAIGGGMLTPPAAPHSSMAVTYRTQHAALLIFQDIWKEFNNPGAIPIYIQDPLYSEIDEKVAARFGMEVVNGDIGHQIGWRLLGKPTCLVDLRICFVSVHQAHSETMAPFHPCALISPCPITPDTVVENDPHVYNLKIHGQTVQCPGLGVSQRATIQRLLTHYTEEKMDLEGMDLGTDANSPPGRDGCGGYSYLGSQPTLYINRNYKP